VQLQPPQDSKNYHSYLLRLWRVEMTNGTVWRASLERVGSRERRGFAQLEHLYTFLEQQCQAQQEPTREGDEG
jgi:hypothetical protein